MKSSYSYICVAGLVFLGCHSKPTSSEDAVETKSGLGGTDTQQAEGGADTDGGSPQEVSVDADGTGLDMELGSECLGPDFGAFWVNGKPPFLCARVGESVEKDILVWLYVFCYDEKDNRWKDMKCQFEPVPVTSEVEVVSYPTGPFHDGDVFPVRVRYSPQAPHGPFERSILYSKGDCFGSIYAIVQAVDGTDECPKEVPWPPPCEDAIFFHWADDDPDLCTVNGESVEADIQVKMTAKTCSPGSKDLGCESISFEVLEDAFPDELQVVRYPEGPLYAPADFSIGLRFSPKTPVRGVPIQEVAHVRVRGQGCTANIAESDLSVVLKTVVEPSQCNIMTIDISDVTPPEFAKVPDN